VEAGKQGREGTCAASKRRASPARDGLCFSDFSGGTAVLARMEDDGYLGNLKRGANNNGEDREEELTQKQTSDDRRQTIDDREGR
jgi:hypothetical protein